jgi:hypothetical protein
MKISDTKDDCESSWISISSLKKAANISAVIENFQSEHTLPMNLSTISEWKISDDFNQSVSYNKMHFSQDKKHIVPTYGNLLKKIVKLNEEIAILSQQLKLSNKEIERLNSGLEKLQKENALKLQFMQEQHEKRLQKTKSDLDFLLKDMNVKSTAILADHFLKKHSEDIENIKQFYEKKIENLRSQHESELVFKDMEQEKLLNDLKHKFFKYVTEIEKQFKKDLSSIKVKYNKENIESQKENLTPRCKENEAESDYEMNSGFDFDAEFSKKIQKSGINPRLKISIADLIERISCESCASTRRESR